ncbi:reverse transcriptase domain-containing protein [Tanacetum coccineum]
MVTPVEKRSSNKFCDFYNDKGHITDKCIQLKKQIEELVRAGKLSHLIKEIKQGIDQSKVGNKEVPAKDKSMAIYMGAEGLLVIEAEIGGNMIHRMYVDGGSLTEVLYEHCFNRLRPEIKSQMVPVTTSLTDFSGETIWPLGQLRLLVTIGDPEQSTKAWTNLMIVRSLSPYNGIIGRPRIREIQVVPSTAHEMLKFLVDGGIVTIRSTILIPTKCATVTTLSKEILKEAEVRHENFKVALHPNFLDQEVTIEGTLSVKGRTELCSRQEKGPGPETCQSHPSRDLNKACPHDCYSLPEIDWKVESLYGYPFKCFLNAYKGYHQIQMAESDEEKTAFHTSHGVYCYTKMPFSLKNAGATYQLLVDKAFDNQVGWNIEVYIDDLVIKSHTKTEMIRDMDETFHTLQKINMKLNPQKCTFGAVEGMFLGYMISPEGIKSCPNKTKAVLLLSKSAKKSLPLFKTLKKCIKKSDFHWTPEAEQAFKQLKQHLSKLPMLVAPKLKEELIVYLSASHRAISTVLITERGMVQTPVYFILADFLIKKPDEAPPDTSVVETPQELWTLFMDRSSCVDGSEYEVLIASLRIAAQMGVRNVHASVDSKLVENQVLRTYVAKEENMIKYLEKAKSLVSGFANFSISQVPRSKNKKADALSKITSTSFAYLSKQVLVEVLKEKSIQEKEVVTVVEEDGPTWMILIMEYLKDRTLPDDRKEASKLRINAREYKLLEGALYMRSFLKPWLRCVGPHQADYVIQEIHEGSCSMHAGPRSVVAKAIWLGYYLPTMHREARDMIRKSGPFSEGPGNVKFLIVAMDYFTKWIEANAMATISGSEVKKFVWDNIVCRFGLPGEIVSDNVKHPQSNGLVERANRSLGEGIKARMGEGNKNWIEELSHVLWAHRTIIKSSHDDTPFSLTYGTEAVIPMEVRMPTKRERAAIREAKAKLKMTTMLGSEVLLLDQETLFIIVMMQVMLWMGGILAQSGKDLMRSRKQSEIERTS